MIVLDYPSVNDGYYYLYNKVLYGPFCPNGQKVSTNITLVRDYGDFVEERGVYGENDVLHKKCDGELTYHRPLVELTSSPSREYPRFLSGQAFSAGIKSNILAEGGIATSGESHIINRYYNSYGGGWMTLTVAWEQLPDASWRRYSVTTNDDRPQRPLLYEIEHFTMLPGNTPKQWEILRSTSTWSLYATVDVGIDLTSKTSFNDIKNLATGTVVPSSYTSVLYKEPISFSGDKDLSPAAFIDGVLSLCAKSLRDVSEHLPDSDYGELALEAGQKFSINNVNMLQFLSDLRHPTRMIPKLKNLSRLKDYANSYLTIKYGVLPTVDDVKSIWKAFRRYRPFYDKNGFIVVTHVQVLSTMVDYIDYKTEHRIKLAIDKEDQDFQLLIESMGSLGVLPDLQNIWDLIPYSFVIDWLIGVGGLLERIDMRQQLARLNIRYTTMSRKDTTEISVDELNLPITGKLVGVQYHRWVSDQCPAPPLSLRFKADTFDHWIEGGALIIQRTKH